MKPSLRNSRAQGKLTVWIDHNHVTRVTSGKIHIGQKYDRLEVYTMSCVHKFMSSHQKSACVSVCIYEFSVHGYYSLQNNLKYHNIVKDKYVDHIYI